MVRRRGRRPSVTRHGAADAYSADAPEPPPRSWSQRVVEARCQDARDIRLIGTPTATMVRSVTAVHMRGLCAPAWSTAPGRRPDPGRCWQLTTRLMEINGSLAVLTGRSADSFEYQMLRGIRLAFRRLLLRAGESPARRRRHGSAAGPADSDLSYCRHPRAAGSRGCRRSGRAEDAQNGAARGRGSCLIPLDWRAPGSVDGSRQDSGPMTAGRRAEEGVL
jgi:hypothetical protein